MLNKFYIPWNSVALVAATAKTILELPTPANQNIEVVEAFVFFDYASTTLGSVVAEFGTFTTTGTGTAATPQKWGSTLATSIITGAKVADTAEPAGFSNGTLGGTIYPSGVLPLPGGPLQLQFALQEGLVLGATGATNYGLRLTSTVACNTRGWVAWKE